jgi:hypothetical protein
MPIEFQKNRVVFRDIVRVDEAEALLEVLQMKPATMVDLAACTHLHTANLQVLMVAKPCIEKWPQAPELRAWLEAVLLPATKGR